MLTPIVDLTKSVTACVTARVNDRVMTYVEYQMFGFGKVIMVKKNDCIVLCEAGPRSGEKLRLPLVFPEGGLVVGNDTFVLAQTPTEEQPVKAKRAPCQRAADGQPSKISVCRALYAANASFTREQMIELFIKEGKCTPAGAVTYVSMCKKG